jgi:DNA-directed RNA polymerase subunit RPC12/RpoP
MVQSFKCQKCGDPVPAKDNEHHEITGDRYYNCPSCKAKNRVVQLPTPKGAPIQFIADGLLD